MARAGIIRLSAWQLMVVFSVFYMTVVWLGYRWLDEDSSRRARSGQVLKPGLDNDGSFKIYAKECHRIFTPKRGSGFTKSLQVVSLKENTCPLEPLPEEPTMQMEKMWASMSVKYPQYVYTLSGWIQVIDVPNYSPKPLKVFIVPHSHQDPGWIETFEGYYQSYTQKTLNNIVANLSKNPAWKFIWSEVAFLEKWFKDPANPREEFKRLVANGQLEIVTGGWVMSDEAVAHFSSMLDQLVEGHLWLRHNLGVTPNVSWSVDPFGHSPSMTYLLKQAGIDQMVIQRVHFGIKRHLAQRKQLEFVWRQAWDAQGKTGVLCHMMPFLSYAIHYSCGPDPHVCCQFDFYREQCRSGSNFVPVLTVNKRNVRKLAWSLWEQLQKKAQLYGSNVLLVPHGDDFRYTARAEWQAQFGNMGKLMDYINKDPDMNTQIQFGTVSDFFKALSEDAAASSLTFPSMTGDFLPYNDRDDQYWTGFYSSRPLHKHMARTLQSKLRITEILFTAALAHPLLALTFQEKKFSNILVSARRTLALIQHHDAITGTSRKYVMRDYALKLLTAIEDVNSLLAMLNLCWMARQEVIRPKILKARQPSVVMWDKWLSVDSYPQLRTSHSDGLWFVIVTNPQTIAWVSPVTFRTITPSIVKTKDGTVVPSQINPVFGPGLQPLQGVYDIIFVAEVAPLSMRTYQVVEDPSRTKFATVTVYGEKFSANSFISEFQARKSSKAVIELENSLLHVAFSTCSGTLQTTLRKTDQTVYQTEIKIMTYGTGSWTNPFRDSSGAYIFMPRGQAQEIVTLYPSIAVIQGPIVSSVMSSLPGVRHTASLYHTEGPLGAAVYIDNLVDIGSSAWDNTELVMRLETNVFPPESEWCVDLNGFQMHRKKGRSKFLIQGNYHPMTSMVYIEDDHQSRITLMTSHTHGASTQDSGSLEVVLDRRLMQDDWRGLREGVKDNVATPSSFILLVEKGVGSSQPKGPSCRPSILAHLLESHLTNPQQVALVLADTPVNAGSWLPAELKDTVGLLRGSEAWPCLYSLLNLRKLSTGEDGQGVAADEEEKKGALMILHKTAIDCGFPETHISCNMDKTLNFEPLGVPAGVKIRSAVETSLTGAVKGKHLDKLTTEMDSMEIKTFRVVLGSGV